MGADKGYFNTDRVVGSQNSNGDYPCSPSSSPSPERIDESVLGKSPLEESILLLPEFAIVLE
jgi:hypothetical protein